MSDCDHYVGYVVIKYWNDKALVRASEEESQIVRFKFCPLCGEMLCENCGSTDGVVELHMGTLCSECIEDRENFDLAEGGL